MAKACDLTSNSPPPGSSISVVWVCVPAGTLLQSALTARSRSVPRLNDAPDVHPEGVRLQTVTLACTGWGCGAGICGAGPMDAPAQPHEIKTVAAIAAVSQLRP